MATLEKSFVFVSIAITAIAIGFTSYLDNYQSETNQQNPIHPSVSQQNVPPGIIEPSTFVELSNNSFILPPTRYSPEELIISGFIKDYARGSDILTVIHFPDDTSEKQRFYATSNGDFKAQIFLTNEHPPGNYELEISYRGETITKFFDIVEPIKKEILEAEIIEDTWQGVLVEGDDFSVPRIGEKNSLSISGHVNNVNTSSQIKISIIDPKDLEKNYTVLSTKNGDFSLLLQLDSKYASGKYVVKTSTLKSQFGESVFVLEAANYSQNNSQIVQKSEIPLWIKNTAKWWAQGIIDDSDFTGGIQHLMKEKIINISDLPESSETSEQKVPDWVKNNAGWWADGSISEDDFVSGIKFLVENGIIRVN